MTTNQPHARAFDLPGWPCPPRVRDVTSRFGSWGWVQMGIDAVVVQDDLGLLWANGDAIPRFQLPNESYESPGALAFWTEQGLGIYIHPKSLPYLGNISRLDMESDQWVPIAVAAAELPDFVTASIGSMR